MMSKKIKIIFFGTTAFAVESLSILNDNFNVIAVITAEDKPAANSSRPLKNGGSQGRQSFTHPS